MMAYYYFNFHEVEKRTLDSFVRYLIIQLNANLSETPRELSELYKYSRANKQEPSPEA